MQAGSRLQAAIEILAEITERGRAASVALSDWGRNHRFAGSGDRAAIGNLVYDALRQKQSLAFLMGDASPRAIALGALRRIWGMAPDEIDRICDGQGFAPAALTPAERNGLESGDLTVAPPWVRGNYPEWLHPSFSAVFGDEAASEGAALAERAPIDLRVNTLKATREKVLKALGRHGATITPYSPVGVRIPPREGPARSPNIEADPAHGRGWFEVQDEGSQIAALMAGAAPRLQMADICAGAGGKSLAFAAAMQNTGQIYAYDADPVRFRPIFERLKRAGARNIQTLPPGQATALDALDGRMDLVAIDAPCSGTGVWRRRPDAKWRFTAEQLARRLQTQRELLLRGASLVKEGGSLVYITCSVLPEENNLQVAAFLQAHHDFSELNTRAIAANTLAGIPPHPAIVAGPGLFLTPARHGTDGFYVAVMKKAG